LPQGRGNVSSSSPISADEPEKHEEEAMGRPKMEKRSRRTNPKYTGVEWAA
jgi:hypothetical protein